MLIAGLSVSQRLLKWKRAFFILCRKVLLLELGTARVRGGSSWHEATRGLTACPGASIT